MRFERPFLLFSDIVMCKLNVTEANNETSELINSKNRNNNNNNNNNNSNRNLLSTYCSFQLTRI